MGVVVKITVPDKVPYYNSDPKGDHSLSNHPLRLCLEQGMKEWILRVVPT